MDWLKELIKDVVAEDKINEVIDSINKEFPKHAVPKSEFNNKLEEIKLLKKQSEDNKGLLDELTKKAENVEEYEKNLTELKSKYEELEKNSTQEINKIQKKTAFKELLLENKVHKDALDLLVNSQNLEELEIEDGKLTNTEKLIETLKAERGGLFIQETEDSTNKNENTDKAETGDNDLRVLFGLPPTK